MKVLQDFKRHGYEYRLLERTSSAAIFAQYLDNGDGSPELISYEVVRVICHPLRTIMGRTVEAGESYPGDSAWGTHGFTCMNFTRAMEIYTILNQSINK